MWDDATKFRNETIRTLIFAVLGFWATVWIIKPSEKYFQYQTELDKKRIEIRRAVVDDFLRSSYHYTSVTYNVLNNEPDAKELEWKDNIYDNYRSDMNRLNNYFKADFKGLPAKAEILCADLKEHYDGKEKNCQWKECREKLKEVNTEIAKIALGDLRLVETPK